MITAAISAVVGGIFGIAPDILKIVKDDRDHAHEIEFARVTNELQIQRLQAGAEGRLQEAQAGIMSEEIKAVRETLTKIIENQFKPTGIKWIDAFNSLLRPSCTLMIIILFMGTAGIFVYGVTSQYASGTMDAITLANVIWGSLVGESIQAVLAFLFGARQIRKIAVT